MEKGGAGASRLLEDVGTRLRRSGVQVPLVCNLEQCTWGVPRDAHLHSTAASGRRYLCCCRCCCCHSFNVHALVGSLATTLRTDQYEPAPLTLTILSHGSSPPSFPPSSAVPRWYADFQELYRNVLESSNIRGHHRRIVVGIWPKYPQTT
ncbi:uncharacterized protein LOC125500152 [Athalia rosae]|uniref:uncharacterized protein LOC125500152 n=1 Tax=Athalia rosae TaxID=37344 RepID=UPI0020335E46|nr:uncharacterized protein LOC125500152 [Athalia rosae]